MDRETARQTIRTKIKCTDYLTKSKSGLYCCPYCGSGTGTNATGAVKYYPETNTYYCHACKRSGDVIDLYQLDTGTDYNTALSLMAQEIGIDLEPYSVAFNQNKPTLATPAHYARSERPRNDFNEHEGISMPKPENGPQNGAERPETAPADYTAYYQACRERLTDPEAVAYLQSRGISVDTAAAYSIGYDPAADPAQSNHPCPRIIIPTNSGHYIGRSIDPNTQKAFAKMNPKGSTPAIFNESALYAHDVQAVFVTEGAFDALSILEAGTPAISLNSAANADALIRLLELRRTDATLILCLDNDERGKQATETIRAGLQRLNISYITANICGKYKDPNEHLTQNRDAFLDAVAQAKQQTAARPDNTAYYIDTLMTGEIERFKDDKKTGFANLDLQAGGLYGGLYVLAAISSLGKTSFALQLADQLAERGNDVVFFSLEQSRLELVSKSLARRTAQKDMAQAVTSLAIRKGYLPQRVLDASREYKAEVADRISIVEGNFSCNVSFIGNYIRQYIQRTGTRPVVFVDYLQILQPSEDLRRQSTKEAVDFTVTELKRLSRELDLTVIVISSVNRANYLTPIDFESLKESGSIEYSCDVLWGLQLQCLSDPEFDNGNAKTMREKVQQAKVETPRKIELRCLKNRYGVANYSCYFDYYPANDLFREQEQPSTAYNVQIGGNQKNRTNVTRM